MPYAITALDGTRIYFEDTAGSGIPVVLHGGLLDCVDDVRESAVARALPPGEFRASTLTTADWVAATSRTTPRPMHASTVP